MVEHKLEQSEVIQSVYDPVTGTLKVSGATGGGGPASAVEITDGVDTATITPVGAKKALDVNVVDITLDHNNDSVSVPGVAQDSTIASGNTKLDTLITQGTRLKWALDEYSASVTYYGRAAAGSSPASAVWQIVRLTKTGTETIEDSADGNFAFDNVWDNRLSLSYS